MMRLPGDSIDSKLKAVCGLLRVRVANALDIQLTDVEVLPDARSLSVTGALFGFTPDVRLKLSIHQTCVVVVLTSGAATIVEVVSKPENLAPAIARLRGRFERIYCACSELREGMMCSETHQLQFDDYTVLARLTPAEEGGYTVTFPHLPGCVSEGDTREEALTNAREAADLWLTDAATRLLQRKP